MTLAEAQAELSAAIAAAGITMAQGIDGLSAPGGIAYPEGIDVAHIGRGDVLASFRVTLIAGAWDAAASMGELLAMIGTALGAVRALKGWQVDDVPPVTVANVAGSQYLAADIIAARMCNL